MDIEEFVEAHTETMPVNHQFAKIVLGAVIGFIAEQLAEKAYVAIYEAVQRRGSNAQAGN